MKKLILVAASVATLTSFPSCNGNSHSLQTNAQATSRAATAHHQVVCSVVDTCEFTSECSRYKRITYLHEQFDHCGRLVKSWTSEKTIKLDGGSYS